MNISITVVDDAGNTVTWEGSSDDQFDCWEVVGSEPASMNADAHKMIDKLQAAAHRTASN